MTELTAGKILIADPFLKDPNFMRTVVFICEHSEESSFGFVLTRKYDQNLEDLMDDINDVHFDVYYGGPVQMNTLHFLHRRPDLIQDGVEVTDGIFWGGDFSVVIEMLKENRLNKTDIRFFIGYSGWGERQLEKEMMEKTWITGNADFDLIFQDKAENTWKMALDKLGGEFTQLKNYPIDPQLN